MPQRLSVRTIPSPEIQGDDSWVKLSAVKLGEVMHLQDQIEKAGQTLTPLEQARVGIQVLADHILGWNWVDDVGKALPTPTEDPTVIEGLTDTEAFWLLAQFSGPSKAELKN